MSEKNFDQLNLDVDLLRAISDMGYTEMTDIQEKLIPVILTGQDVIGQSSTGTGKTAAFGLPAIQMLGDGGNRDPRVLVLCPTRELAMQVSGEIIKYAKYKPNISVATIYGGASINVQFQELAQCDVVVGTPGRIIDHLKRGTLELKYIKMAVMDEADEMLDMGFLDDIRYILRSVPRERQTMLMSATMPQPIRNLAERFMREPAFLRGDDGQVAFELIRQYFCEVPVGKKVTAVRMLLEQEALPRVLIFSNTKVMVDILAGQLRENGIKASGLHGDMAQSARSRIMAQFKAGEVNVLVATDVAARGIDATGIDAIINFDIPQDIDFYVHRIGRTGRAGHEGLSFTLVAGHGDFFALADVETATGVPLTPFEIRGLDTAPSDRLRGGKERKRREEGPRPERTEKRGRAVSGSGRSKTRTASATLTVDVGSAHDINEEHIVECLTRYTRIRRDEIGDIRIGEQSSTIRLSAENVRYALRTMRDPTVDEFLVSFSSDVQNEDGSAGKLDAATEPDKARRRRHRSGGKGKAASTQSAENDAESADAEAVESNDSASEEE